MKSPIRYEGADGIRGLACLMVLFAHVPGFFIPELAKYFSGTGKYGVWLFFVLSAFLLTNKFANTGFSVSELTGYALGRILRILPLFLVAILIFWYFASAGILTERDAISAATFRQGYAHLWTIPVEFKFYFFLPFIAYLFIAVERKYGHLLASVLAVVIIFSHQLIWPYWNTPENSISTHWYIPSFVLGCYAAVAIGSIRTHVTATTALIIAVFVFISLLLLSPGGRNALLGMPFDGWLQNKFILLSVLWTLFILFLAEGKGAVGSLMKTTFFRRVGAWSYSIYLFHWLFYQKLSFIQHGWLFALLAVLASIGAGAVLHALIESPIERFRHSLQKVLSRRRLETAKR